MFELNFTTQFKKDYKKVKNNKKLANELNTAFEILAKTGTLPQQKYKTHILIGNYKNHNEAHIQQDWLMIWLKIDNEIRLVRTGSHSKLF